MPGGLTLLAGSNASIPTPAAGKVTIFFSTDSNLPAYKDDTGLVHSLLGATGGVGPVGVQGEEGDEPDFVMVMPGAQGNPGPTGSQGPMGVSMVVEEPIIEDEMLSTPHSLVPDFWDVEITKKTNTTVTNSSAYVEDTELRYLLALNGVYLVETAIVFSGNTTAGDYKWEWRGGFNIATANQFDGWYNVMGSLANDSGANSGANVFWGNNNIAMPLNTHDKFVMHQRFGLVVPSSSTSDLLLVYRSAQVVATVGTDAITYAGSRVRIKRLF